MSAGLCEMNYTWRIAGGVQGWDKKKREGKKIDTSFKIGDFQILADIFDYNISMSITYILGIALHSSISKERGRKN